MVRNVKPYKSKQILPIRGNIEVKVRITDYRGVTSVQSGFSNTTNVERHLKQLMDEAILNAVYKHFYNNGGYYVNSRDYNIYDLVKSVVVLNHEIVYFSDLGYYDFKRVNVKGHYYTEIKYKGERKELIPHNNLNKKDINYKYELENEKQKRLEREKEEKKRGRPKKKPRTRKTAKTIKYEGADRTFFDSPLDDTTSKALVRERVIKNKKKKSVKRTR